MAKYTIEVNYDELDMIRNGLRVYRRTIVDRAVNERWFWDVESVRVENLLQDLKEPVNGPSKPD